MSFGSITILYNPNSTGPSQKKAEKLAKRLGKLDYGEVTKVIPTEYPGHGEELAYKYGKSDNKPLIISSSGDGGYNEVINGVMKAKAEGYDVVTGLLPSGNANDHHKELHDKDIIKQIKTEQTKEIDLITVSAQIKGKEWTRFAHSYIGFGITPEVSKELNKTDLTPAKEIAIALKTLANSKPLTIIRRNKKKDYFSIIISNVSRMGKFFNLSKDSFIDDGKFEVFTIEPKPASILRNLLRSATSSVPHTVQTNKFTFKTIEKLPVQLDGEVYEIDADTTVVISIKRKIISCVI